MMKHQIQKDKTLHVLFIICISFLSTVVVDATNPHSTSSKRNGSWLGNILGTSGIDHKEDVAKANAKAHHQPPPPPPPPAKAFTGTTTHQHMNVPPAPLPSVQTNNDRMSNATLDGALNVEAIARDGVLIGSKDEMMWSQDQLHPGHWGMQGTPHGDANQYWQAHPPHTEYPYGEYQNPPWHQHPSQHQHSTSELQAEIDSLLSHQYELYSQIHNLTHTLSESDRKFDIQMNQIDLLLEQVADAEAHASAESNAALEHKTNCTRLAQDIITLEQTIEEWEKKYSHIESEKELKDKEIAELKSRLKKKERELENMACGIEMARLENEREENSQMERKKNKKKNIQNNGGILQWIFGWIWDTGSNSYSSTTGNSLDSDSDSDEVEKLQELARSTLLQALQSERDNVEELEAALSVAQQNNTAIAEMVSSRDSLVNELNDRISVFEEDKIVLKAALKQLQKEMKDEAPKTLQLIDDLNSAKETIKKLEEKIKAMKKIHADDIKSLDEKLTSKDMIINETDTKMSMISTYVDQLEERLASFSIAKKKIADREVECDEIVAKAAETETKFLQLENEKQTITEERDELKTLVNLMAEERSVLLGEKERLTREKESLVFETKALKEELDLLNDNFLSIEAEAVSVKEQIDDLTEQLKRKEEILTSLHNEKNSSDKELSEKDDMINQSIILAMNMQDQIKLLTDEKNEAEKMIFLLEQKLADMITSNNTQQEYDESINIDSTDFIPPPPPLPPQVPPPPPQRFNDDIKSQGHALSDMNVVEDIEGNQNSSLNRDVEKDLLNPDIETIPSDSRLSNVTYQEDIEDRIDPMLEQMLSDDEHDSVLEGDVHEHVDFEDGNNTLQDDRIVSSESNLEPGVEPPFPENPAKFLPNEKMGVHLTHEKRNVPFRRVRKTFAKVTDMHGVFTPSSSSKNNEKASHDKGRPYK